MSFASNLKAAMAAKNISQAELADISGISKSGISQYLSGKYQPKGKIINKLAEALDCTANYLMYEEDEPGTNNVSVEQAAKILGVSQQFVRIALQQGILPIGRAVKMSSKYTYQISLKKLNDYMNNAC